MKKIVALEAFSRIENGMTVYLDSGSTILTAISALRNKKRHHHCHQFYSCSL